VIESRSCCEQLRSTEIGGDLSSDAERRIDQPIGGVPHEEEVSETDGSRRDDLPVRLNDDSFGAPASRCGA
jgi:hypothetical protein